MNQPTTAVLPKTNIQTRPLRKTDYDFIVRIMDTWWGGPTAALAHPVYFYELGEHAVVADLDDRVVGFLLGFVAPASQPGSGPCGYVHLVGIDPEYRRKHVGTLLYTGFEASCRTACCSRMKAITTLGNEASLGFHLAQGWESNVVSNYAGPGRDRMVFTKALITDA